MTLLIARTLGRTIAELGQTMSAHEYGIWVEAYREAPWAELRLEDRQKTSTDGAELFAVLTGAKR